MVADLQGSVGSGCFRCSESRCVFSVLFGLNFMANLLYSEVIFGVNTRPRLLSAGLSTSNLWAAAPRRLLVPAAQGEAFPVAHRSVFVALN